MIAFKDPVTGKPVRRLTTMGKELSIGMIVGGDQSQEGNQWSSDSRWVTFTFSGHPSYPTGIYLVNVEDGTIRFLALTGHGARSSTFSVKNPNEVYYFYINRTGNASTSWVELRAVDITTCAGRVIKRYAGAFDCLFSSQSYDGKWLFFTIDTGDQRVPWIERKKQNVMVNLLTGEDHPWWTYDPDYKLTDNSDGALWNPVNHSEVLAPRFSAQEGKLIKRYVNVDKLTDSRLGVGTAHSAIHPNGRWLVGGTGLRDTGNNCLNPNCDSPYGKGYGIVGHPFADLSNAGLGWDARIVTDVPDGGAVLLEPTWAIIRDTPIATWKKDVRLRIAAWYGSYDGASHPHPQYSPNGRHIVWCSNLRVTQVHGPPPGPDDGLATTSDIFVIDHRR
jgi:hypothetical protein